MLLSEKFALRRPSWAKHMRCKLELGMLNIVQICQAVSMYSISLREMNGLLAILFIFL